MRLNHIDQTAARYAPDPAGTVTNTVTPTGAGDSAFCVLDRLVRPASFLAQRWPAEPGVSQAIAR